MTLICLLGLGFLAQISVEYSRGWMVLFYVATLAALIVQRYIIVRVSTVARAAGLLSAQRIFLIGTGEHVGAFINRYEPWAIGINIVGCRFLTPVTASASAEVRRAMLDRDLAEAIGSVRGVAPTRYSFCCRGLRPQLSNAAPKPSTRFRSNCISALKRSCISLTTPVYPRSDQSLRCS